jgi:hypothetical protein
MGLLDLKLILIICISIIVYFLYKEILSIRSRLNVITKQVSSISSISLIKDNIKSDINDIITTSSDIDSISEQQQPNNILNMFTNMFNKKNKITLDNCNYNTDDTCCNYNADDMCCNYNILDNNKKIHKIVYDLSSDNIKHPILTISDNIKQPILTISDNIKQPILTISDNLDNKVQNTKIINIEYKQIIENNAEVLEKQYNTEISEENSSHLEVFSNDTENKILSQSITSSNKSSDDSNNKSSDKSNNKSSDKSNNKSSDESNNKSSDKSNNKSSDESNNKSSDKSNNKSSDESNNKSNNKSNDKSNNKSNDKSNNNTTKILKQSESESESKILVSETNTLVSVSESNNNKSITRLKLPELQDRALELKIPLSINGKKKTRVELINDIRNHT